MSTPPTPGTGGTENPSGNPNATPTLAPTSVDYGPLAFNTKERTKAEYNLIAATSSKLARQQLKLACPADYSKMKDTLTKGTHDKLPITGDLVEKDGKLNLDVHP